jgi:hypothetical protein
MSIDLDVDAIRDELTSGRSQKDTDANQQLRALAALAALRNETLAMYVPLETLRPLHEDRALWKIVDGVNQAGKTAGLGVEFARAACGCDPHHKYPEPPLKTMVVGLTERHLASPLYSTLFKPGVFSMIRDEHTTLWRFIRVDPNDPARLDPYDEAHRDEWKDTPPIIPPRLIKSRAWRHKASEVPTKITLTNGSTIEFISSEAPARQGVQWHLGWIDEQLKNEQHVVEFGRGAMRYGGTGLWSATPQTVNPQLLDLRERAENGDPDVQAIKLSILDNPFISMEAREQYRKLLNDAEAMVRMEGEYRIAGMRIYPRFEPQGMHGCEPFAVPPSWCRYCIVDPGIQFCGCVLAAIPPDERHAYVYASFTVPQNDSAKWASAVAAADPGANFHAFIIDWRMGNQRGETDRGLVQTAEFYWKALVEAGLRPHRQGPCCGFFKGTDKVQARQTALQEWLTPRGDGPFVGEPYLQVMRGQAPGLERQMKLARTQETDPTKRAKQAEDELVCLEYFAGARPRYHAPPRRTAPRTRSNVPEHLRRMVESDISGFRHL